MLESRWPALGAGGYQRGITRGAQYGATLAPVERFGVYDVYGTYLGGPEYLDGVFASNVTQLRRLTDVEEYAAFGRQHPAGAVVITRALHYRRRRRPPGRWPRRGRATRAPRPTPPA